MGTETCSSYTGFVGTTSTNGSRGVYKISLDGVSGTIRVLDAKSVYNSGYLTISPDRRSLYVLSEGMTFQGKASGGITSFDISDGKFEVSGRMITKGQRPCFVNCDRTSGRIYVGNFFGGTIIVFDPAQDGSAGEETAYIVNEKLGPFGPAVHCVCKSPGGRYLLALELSGDCICVYDEEQNYRVIFRESFERGAMPRHLTFSEDGRYVYVDHQGDEKVSVYRFDDAAERILERIQVISVRDEEMIGKTEPAAIRICPGRNLLAVSNRGMGTKHREDSVTLFSIDPADGTLTRSAVVRTGGQMPRDFNFTPDGKFLVVGYQFQGYLDVYRVDDAADTLTYVGRGADIPSPVCIAF